MNTNMSNSSPSTYTPGYVKAKMLFVAYGLLLIFMGASQLYTPLRLLLRGQHVRAEACRVIKSKKGLPDVELYTNAQVQSALETRDRSYIFWNEFTFQTTQGKSVVVRAPVASLLKPLYPLSDADGLPTTDLLCYDLSNPSIVVFPLIVSTWFAPGFVTFAGLLAVSIGSTLLYWARKPIELPNLHT